MSIYSAESKALGDACLRGEKVPVAIPVRAGAPHFRMDFWDVAAPKASEYRIQLSSLSNMANNSFRVDRDRRVSEAVYYILSKR